MMAFVRHHETRLDVGLDQRVHRRVRGQDNPWLAQPAHVPLDHYLEIRRVAHVWMTTDTQKGYTPQDFSHFLEHLLQETERRHSNHTEGSFHRSGLYPLPNQKHNKQRFADATRLYDVTTRVVRMVTQAWKCWFRNAKVFQERVHVLLLIVVRRNRLGARPTLPIAPKKLEPSGGPCASSSSNDTRAPTPRTLQVESRATPVQRRVSRWTKIVILVIGGPYALRQQVQLLIHHMLNVLNGVVDRH